MDRILGPAISGFPSAALGMDKLAEFVAQVEPPRSDTGLRKCVAESKFGQLAYRGRLQIDADTKRCGIAHGLVDTNRYSSLMQAERKAQPADAASSDDDVEILHRAA